MSSNTRNALLGGAALLALVLLILLSGGGQEERKESHLFKTNWEMIEYVPPADYYVEIKDKAKDAKADDPSKKARAPKTAATGDRHPHRLRGAKDAAASHKEEDAKGRLALKFIRKSGLYRDQFEALTPQGGVPGAREVRHRGSATVRNIFTTWGKLVVKAAYSLQEAGGAEQLGLGSGAPRVRLFESRAGNPITVTLGRRLENGQMFVTTDRPEDRDNVYLIQGTDDFRHTYVTYRERRVVLYPTKSFSARLRAAGGGQTVLLTQRQIEVKGTQQPEWTDSQGRNIPSARVTTLENAVKQASLSRFQDEGDLSAYGDTAALWQKGSEAITAEVSVHGGDSIRIEYRLPHTPISPGGNPMVLIQNSLDDAVYFADRAQYDNLLRGLREVVQEQKRIDQTRKAPAAKSPARPKAPGSPMFPPKK